MLFAGTVRQNITMWDDSVPDHLIIQALRDAQILDEVLARPNGIDTDIREGGSNFSTGETQRLEIARSLVRNPSILVMDEATSALDTAMEKAMDDAVRARGCSTIIIAHRLSTIRDADEIIVLGRGGDIRERGTNDVLIAAGESTHRWLLMLERVAMSVPESKSTQTLTLGSVGSVVVQSGSAHLFVVDESGRRWPS